MMKFMLRLVRILAVTGGSLVVANFVSFLEPKVVFSQVPPLDQPCTVAYNVHETFPFFSHSMESCRVALQKDIAFKGIRY